MSEKERIKVQGYTRDKIYELIPAVYRNLDADSGRSLEALIQIIARQVDVLEKDISGLYDDWFIETCSEWVTAYIADLVGTQSLATSRVSSSFFLSSYSPFSSSSIPYSAFDITEQISQRAYVANTISRRRRKGILAIVEQLARDITQWDSHAVEFFQLLTDTQHLNHLRLQNYRTPDLRNTSNLELLNTPFDSVAHTVEVRRISSGRGYYNIPNIGIFLWRLQAFPSQDTLAFPMESSSEMAFTRNQCFTFHPLGYDEPIFNTPATEAEVAEISGEVNAPAPIRIRALYDNLRAYYGRSLSVMVRYTDDPEEIEIPVKDIEVCSLAKWRKPANRKVAVDPVLGRIRLSKDASEVRVTYYYGFSAEMGGGFYTRNEIKIAGSDATVTSLYRVSKRKVFSWNKIPGDTDETDRLRALLMNHYRISWLEAGTAFANDGRSITASQGTHSLSITLGAGNITASLRSDGIDVATLYPREVGTEIYVSQEPDLYGSITQALVSWEKQNPTRAVIEITDSELYDEEIKLSLSSGIALEIRAAQEERPILRKPANLQGEKGSSLQFNGLWFDASPTDTLLTIQPGDMESLAISHCTLVPGRDNQSIDKGLAIGVNSSMRRRLCSWDDIGQNAEAMKLQQFLNQKLGLTWVSEGAQFEKGTESGGVEYIQYEGTTGDELRIELDLNGSIAVLRTKRSSGNNADESEWKKVYEFSILPQSGKKIMYLEGGNNNLQVGIQRSICGRIDTLNSLVLVWNKIPDDIDATHNLIGFLKNNFELEWLTDATPFLRTDNRLKATSSDSSRSVAFTLDPVEKRAVLAIDGKDIQEFIAINKSLYWQSDAQLYVADSIIDSNGGNEKEAIVSRSAKIERTTVLGKTRVDEIELASNSIFADTINVRKDQKGCVRFSYVPDGSKTPRKYKCLPNESNPHVKPSFTSTRYGDPGYGQIHRKVDVEIFEGADNGAEMGAFNYLLQALRIRDLKTAIDEYLRFGLEAGVFLVT